MRMNIRNVLCMWISWSYFWTYIYYKTSTHILIYFSRVRPCALLATSLSFCLTFSLVHLSDFLPCPFVWFSPLSICLTFSLILLSDFLPCPFVWFSPLSICLTFSRVHFRNSPEYFTSETVLVFLALMRFLQLIFVSRFLVLLKYFFPFFFVHLILFDDVGSFNIHQFL